MSEFTELIESMKKEQNRKKDFRKDKCTFMEVT